MVLGAPLQGLACWAFLSQLPTPPPLGIQMQLCLQPRPLPLPWLEHPWVKPFDMEELWFIEGGSPVCPAPGFSLLLLSPGPFPLAVGDTS